MKQTVKQTVRQKLDGFEQSNIFQKCRKIDIFDIGEK
jgi:hypothetical protein